MNTRSKKSCPILSGSLYLFFQDKTRVSLSPQILYLCQPLFHCRTSRYRTVLKYSEDSKDSLQTYKYSRCTVNHCLKICKLKRHCHKNFCYSFFHESTFPNPLKRTLGSFRIFSKIRGDIWKSRCTIVINNTSGAPWAESISTNFLKNSKRPKWDTQGLGFMKKHEVDNLVALSL